MTNETVNVIAINLEDRQVVIEDGTVLEMASLHDEDGEEVDDVDEASFATVKLPSGKWFAVTFDDFEFPQHLN